MIGFHLTAQKSEASVRIPFLHRNGGSLPSLRKHLVNSASLSRKQPYAKEESRPKEYINHPEDEVEACPIWV
jgi:hypothetical protein